MVSAEQEQWQEICAAVRAGLAKQVEYIPAMDADEVSSLTSAIYQALSNEVNAAAYDESVEERKRSLERGAMYGPDP